MDIITHWQGTPTFPEADKNGWEKLEKAITRNNYAGKCHVSDEDYGNQVVLNIVDLEDESLGIIQYTRGELARVSSRDLSLDFKVVTDLRYGKHTKLLNIVLNYCLENHEWPKSEGISVQVADFGFFWDMAQEIGREYIRVAHTHRSDSLTRLTIKGVSVCDDNISYLLPFKYTVKEIVERYRNNYEHPTITTKELIDKGLFGIGEDSLIYHMIVEEDGLVTEAIAPRGDKGGEFTISRNVLRYVNVDSIRDYLRIQRYEAADPDYSSSFPSARVDSTVESMTRIEEEFRYDIFISYSSKDQKVADVIYARLKESGLKPFLAPKDIDSGYIGSEEIRKALKDSAEMAILMSPNSIRSEWVLTEWGAAWGFDMHVTPVLLNCRISDIPKLLQERQKRDYPKEIDRYIQEVLKRKNAP